VHAGDRVLDDPAVVVVAQALLDELLRRGDREVAHFPAQLLPRAANVLGELGLRGFNQASRFASRCLDQAALLLCSLLERRGPDRLRLRIRGLDFGSV
jgi:hypothetical protein